MGEQSGYLGLSYTLPQPSIFGHHGKQDTGLRWTFAVTLYIHLCVSAILSILLWVGFREPWSCQYYAVQIRLFSLYFEPPLVGPTPFGRYTLIPV